MSSGLICTVLLTFEVSSSNIRHVCPPLLTPALCSRHPEMCGSFNWWKAAPDKKAAFYNNGDVYMLLWSCPFWDSFSRLAILNIVAYLGWQIEEPVWDFLQIKFCKAKAVSSRRGQHNGPKVMVLIISPFSGWIRLMMFFPFLFTFAYPILILVVKGCALLRLVLRTMHNPLLTVPAGSFQTKFYFFIYLAQSIFLGILGLPPRPYEIYLEIQEMQ